MITSVLVALVVLLIAGNLYFKSTKIYPPGPFRWPIVGNIFMQQKLSRTLGGLHLAFLELSRRYRSDVVKFRLGSSDVIAVSGREAIHTVLHNEEYDGRPWNEFIRLRNLGGKNGITMVDGPRWREMRAWFVRKLRLIGIGRREMSDLMMEELTEVLEKIKDGGIFRLKPIVNPVVMNVLWTLSTGKRFNCEKLQRFVELMERRSRAFDLSGGILSALPWIRHIAPEWSGYNLLLTVNTEVKQFLMETINEHKRNYTSGKQDDLIYMFLDEMYKEGSSTEIFTDDQLVMVLMDLFIAGSNTTAATLDFLFLNLTINQDVQERLHREIDEVIGDGRLPDLNDRPRLPYAEAVLAESQRMCVVSPIIGPRRVLKDTVLTGYTIPKETTVLINLWGVNMNPDYYPEPEIFKPERFLKGGVYVPDETAIFFGQGKRRCPGETLARCALFIIVVGVMQRFRLLPVPGQEPPTLVRVPGLILSPKPYEVLLIPRRAES